MSDPTPKVAGVAQPVHATTVARHGPLGWRGVLLTGPSGAGKSDLALRLMAGGWRLVADDYTQVWRSGGGLWATAPERIAGLIEARGLGIVTAPTLTLVRLSLVVVCGPDTPDRAPQPASVSFDGVGLPCVTLDIRPVSAATLVALALDEAIAGRLANGVARGRFQSAPLSSI